MVSRLSVKVSAPRISGSFFNLVGGVASIFAAGRLNLEQLEGISAACHGWYARIPFDRATTVPELKP